MAEIAKVSVVVLAVFFTMISVMGTIQKARDKGATDVEIGGALLGLLFNLWVIIAVLVWWET